MRPIHFSGVGFSYEPDDIEVVKEAMLSVQTLTQGPYQKSFETKFAEKYGYKHSFAVSSAAAAIELSRQKGIKRRICSFSIGISSVTRLARRSEVP